MDSWSFEDGSDGPALAYQRMVREEETAEDLIRTAQIVTPTDRGQDLPQNSSTVEDIAMQLAEMSKGNPGGQTKPDHRVPSASVEEAADEETSEHVLELRTSAVFPIDDQATFTEQDKLEFISMALRTEHQFDDSCEAARGEVPSMQIHGSSGQPFIRVSRGREFADAFVDQDLWKRKG